MIYPASRFLLALSSLFPIDPSGSQSSPSTMQNNKTSPPRYPDTTSPILAYPHSGRYSTTHFFHGKSINPLKMQSY